MGRGSIRGAKSAGARETGEKYTPECNFRGGGEEKKGGVGWKYCTLSSKFTLDFFSLLRLKVFFLFISIC